MPITLDEIVEQTALLPKDVVAELIERILVRSHGGIELSIDEAWKTESRRRIQEIMDGKVEGIPLEKALAQARSVLRR